jgi:hypothetical protein
MGAICLLALTGCSTLPPTSDIPVQTGMSREDLKASFGEPVRIEPGARGGEDWFYRFVAWQTQPTSEAGSSEDFGEKESHVSVGLDFSKHLVELPIHLSSDGFVVKPVPKGKVVKP